ncbi:alpha/beta fold hydrolase [Mesorhizobium sp. M0187]|uniref:alpha/beta fold hydrolase n=1 Tax=Mesorhizobium sp. M0187 TaxID=2956908 RepID=UPI003337612E
MLIRTPRQLREILTLIDASAAASLAAGPGQTAPGDFWIGWRRQIDALASAGFRVIVPDQRGYNTSDKPKAIREHAPEARRRCRCHRRRARHRKVSPPRS